MANLLKNNSIKAVWLLCHTALILAHNPAIAQHNLVPNGSFEVLDTCPYLFAQLEFAKPWRDIASVDLYNRCSQVSFLNVPNNSAGFQVPKSGNGYAGFRPSGTLGPGHPLPQGTVYHEYPQVELKEPLKRGAKYCYQYFISPTYHKWSNCVLKEMSVLLSEAPISYDWNSLTTPLYIDHPVTHTCYLGFTTDTTAWYEVKGEFQANGGELFLTIGIFRLLTDNDFFCPTAPSNPILGAYYYIDDVSLWYCGPDTIPEPELPTELILPVIPNVFTPNGDGYNDLFAFKNHEGWELEIYIRNRWGKMVYEGKNDRWWDGMINGQPASEGVYYYTVIARNNFGQHETFNGVVTLLR